MQLLCLPNTASLGAGAAQRPAQRPLIAARHLQGRRHIKLVVHAADKVGCQQVGIQGLAVGPWRSWSPRGVCP